MARSEEERIFDEFCKLVSPQQRFVDVGAQVRVWRHRDEEGNAKPGELLPTVYGGRYDRLLKTYVGPPQNIHELKIHPGQLPLVLWDPSTNPGIMHVMALGTPGVGKTTSLAIKAAIEGIRSPNLKIGMVAPTRERREILWSEFLDLVQPLGWVEDINTLKQRIKLTSGTIYDFVAAQRPSRRLGSPFQGKSWHRAFVDESQNVEAYAQRDIEERGRNAGGKYVVFHSATNATDLKWRDRLRFYKENPQTHALMLLIGHENVFLPPGWYDRLKAQYSDRDYRERILLEDLPPEQRIYPSFNWRASIRPRPEYGWTDITAQVAQEFMGRPAKYILGHDPGVRTTYTVALKVYREPSTGERIWWAVDEWLSRSYTTADQHARKIKERVHESDCVAQVDPHINSSDVDKSDYHLLRKEGFDAKPAWNGKIPIRHRIAMVNCLLEDVTGKRRLFIDCDVDRKPRCPNLARALQTLTLPESGQLEAYRKDDDDQTHAPAALGYGLFRVERIRGTPTVFEQTTGEPTEAQKQRRGGLALASARERKRWG